MIHSHTNCPSHKAMLDSNHPREAVVEVSPSSYTRLRDSVLVVSGLTMACVGMILSCGSLATQCLLYLFIAPSQDPANSSRSLVETIKRRRSSSASQPGTLDLTSSTGSQSASAEDDLLPPLDGPSSAPSRFHSFNIVTKTLKRATSNINIRSRRCSIKSLTSLKRSTPSRTNPYQAPFFFPTPASPEAVDYADRVKKERRRRSSDGSYHQVRTSETGEQPSQSRKSTFPLPTFRRQRTSSLTSDPDDDSRSGELHMLSKRPTLRRLFRLSGGTNTPAMQSRDSQSTCNSEPGTEPGKETGKRQWSILRNRQTSSIHSEGSWELSAERGTRQDEIST